jgi:hypothetical protein
MSLSVISPILIVTSIVITSKVLICYVIISFVIVSSLGVNIWSHENFIGTNLLIPFGKLDHFIIVNKFSQSSVNI